MRNNDRGNDDDRDLGRVDGWLRLGLGPADETVERVVRRALASERATRSRPGMIAVGVGVGVGVAVIALVAGIAFLLPRRGPGEPATGAVRADSSVEMLTITNVSGRVVVLYPPGSSDDGLVTSETPALSPEQTTIFNSNGIVAALAAASTPHYVIMGGER